MSSNTNGGVGYADFLKVTNSYSGATSSNKSFRLNNGGIIEIINSAYSATILSLTNPVLEASIEIRKKHRTKLPDAIIAATAIANELVLLTRNVSDFKNIDGIQIIDPHNL